jgi:dihydroneopterin aldolase
MIDALAAVTWAFSVGTTIANSEPGKKFIEGTIGKVAEMVTEAGVAKINDLRQWIIEKLQGNSAAQEAIAQAEAGSIDDLKDVASYLEMAARKDAGLAQELTQRVQEIQTFVQFDDVNADTSLQFFAPVEQVVNKPNAPVIYAKDNVKIELKVDSPKD